MHKLFHPLPLGHKRAVWPRIGEIHVARLDEGLHRLRERELATIGLDRDDARPE